MKSTTKKVLIRLKAQGALDISLEAAAQGVDPIVRPMVGIGSQPLAVGGPGAVGARSFGGLRFGTVSRGSRALIPRGNLESYLNSRSIATRRRQC